MVRTSFSPCKLIWMSSHSLHHRHTLTHQIQGLGIGNGLVDPEIQYQYYGAYAQNNSYGIELVSAVSQQRFF